MAIPILMIRLSLTLPPRASRITNTVVAALYLIVSIGNAVGESWLYYYSLAAGLEVVVLALIVRNAWTWPRTRREVDAECAAAGGDGVRTPRSRSTSPR